MSKLERCILKVKKRNKSLGCPEIPQRRIKGKRGLICSNPFVVCKSKLK